MSTILVVDDEPVVTDYIKEALSEEGYAVEVAYTGNDGIVQAKKVSPDVIILDFMLPDLNGIEVLKKLRQLDESLQVIMLTAYNSVPTALEAVRNGAADYILKPFDLDAFKITVAKICEKAHLTNQLRFLREDNAKKLAGNEFLLCPSVQMAKVYDLVFQVAQTNDTTVLILGESGAGKEHIAKLIHQNSSRAAKPFVEMNCAAIPENLLESELFGHEPGAFTDARSKKLGLFEYADGGTIFLDEIGDMPLATQAKILKVLETKEFRRVGGLRDIKSDVRVVAATNKDLSFEIDRGNFREDLYYRLQVVPIDIPPLRERKEDILHLANFFLEMTGRSMRKRLELSGDAASALLSYTWKGNVRELKNVIERAVIVTPNGSRILPEHLAFKPMSVAELAKKSEEFLIPKPDYEARQAEQQRQAEQRSNGLSFSLSKFYDGFSLKAHLEQIERQYLLDALEKTGGNQLQAAKLLGIERHVLRYQMKKYEIDDPRNSKNSDD
ncbi:two component, sigma54 specific, transcriptional regulator, Fis family [Chloroherpeton thalassium ATCC 35110]|uniref:Two component, sigma54 specific, transcriptional regulator, Fis family n=1 Tax=Chloroherpeton thalassium (strain ATCC 35110 / GB-78) TaxID=517418 RepID=B3QW87_CHLT3|nr:sigma-54 dependent transcriptional regulator [Chloroherpeton thalassium]ACF13200.1 two component, sigma54 specific, transcriptional regulator, Fis family [Chloroherpeton thalassium ATCC 35110]